ncbi:MAG: protein BatD, partial [Planctomycetes bacterium]|nr:protein BatD [Planctomycetota bacterium]
MSKPMTGRLVATLLAAVPGQEPPPVAVSVRLLPERVLVGEPCTVEWQARVDAAWLAEHGLQPFQQPLELPLLVEAPGLQHWPGALARAASFATATAAVDGATRQTVALGERRVAATVARDGDALRITLQREFLPEAAGPLPFPASALKLLWTRGFDDDLLGGRTPRDRHELVVAAPPATLDVVAWPQPAPPAFSGAVGVLALGAALSTPEVAVGDSLTLTITFSGRANFEQFAPPPFAPDGFHVLGRAIERSATSLTATFELLARSTAPTAVPSLAFDWLEPGAPPRWRHAETGALALLVRPRADGLTTLDSAEPVVVDPARLALLAPQKALTGRASRATASWFERGEMARRAARDGDFVAATRWWRAALEETDAPIGALRFNLGHAEFARGRRIEALHEWLLAAPHLPGDGDLRANLRLVADELALPDAAVAAIERWCRDGAAAPTALL